MPNFVQRPFSYCALVIALSLAGCGSEPSPSTSVNAPKNASIELISQDLIQPEYQNIVQKTAFTGTIRAVEQSSIQSQVLASVRQVYVKIGQTVQKDQLLAELNNQDNTARLAQAEANLAAAQAQARQSKLMVDRKKRLLDQGFISKVEYEQSRVDEQAQIENVRAMQATVDIARKANQDGQIRSPIQGVITQRSVEPGQTVSVGQTLFEIVNPQQLELQARLALEESSALRVGQDLEFRLAGQNQSYQAQVTRISPVADLNSRQIEFYALPTQSLPSHVIGAFVEGQILQRSTQSGWKIPLNSIQNIESQASVWIVRNQKLLNLPLVILQKDHAQNYAIVQGLEQQDQVSTISFDVKDTNKAVKVTQNQ